MSEVGKTIINLFPKEYPKMTYVEMYGSSCVWREKQRSKLEIINDVDGYIVSYFQFLQYTLDKIGKEKLFNLKNTVRYKHTFDRAAVERLTTPKLVYKYDRNDSLFFGWPHKTQEIEELIKWFPAIKSKCCIVIPFDYSSKVETYESLTLVDGWDKVIVRNYV